MRILITTLILLVTFNLTAQDSNPVPRYLKGIDYQVLEKPVKTLNRKKIEVTEAFAYGCGHCYRAEPLIKKWKSKLADDVAFVKLPVVYQKKMEYFARIMYTGQALKISEKVNAAVFNMFHIQKKRMNSEAAAAKLFASLGVSAEQFKQTFHSFGVDTQVRRASVRTRAMKVPSTPYLIVDGKYTVSVTRETGFVGTMKVVDFLVNKIRNEK